MDGKSDLGSLFFEEAPQGQILERYQKRGTAVNSVRYTEILRE
jgi:hypothetical protein